MKANCPLLKKEYKERRKDKKKAMIAAWGSDSDSSSSDVEEEVANFCLMANEENNEVFDSSSDSLLDDDLLESYDELLEEFHNLYNKYKSIKKHANTLTNNLEKVNVENKSLKSEKDSLIKENKDLKKKVDKLESTLGIFTRGRNSLDYILDNKKAMFDKSGLGYNKVPYNYTKSSNTKTKFVKPTHYHRTKCIHCNRFNHASYKCPYRFKIPSYMKWVPKTTNPLGPKPT